MKEQLLVPQSVQDTINEINTGEISLGEIQIHEHPLLPAFDRFIKINKIVIDTELPRTYLFYQQVLKNKTTHQVEPSKLPNPEWMIGENEWSFLRDESFNKISVPVVDEQTQEPILDENGELKTSMIKVDTHAYMLWLLKNNKLGFLDLLKTYLNEFVDMKREELDRLS
jgi:hypothetical protein